MKPDAIKRSRASWCPICRTAAGPDCPDRALDLRAAAKKERQRVRVLLARIRTPERT